MPYIDDPSRQAMYQEIKLLEEQREKEKVEEADRATRATRKSVLDDKGFDKAEAFHSNYTSKFGDFDDEEIAI